jgi:hypothetical protein
MVVTAGLLAWLLVAVTRTTLKDLRLPRLHPSPAQPSAIDAPAERTASPPAAERASALETAPSDDLDAEREVREHLYGRRSRTT